MLSGLIMGQSNTFRQHEAVCTQSMVALTHYPAVVDLQAGCLIILRHFC